MDLLLRLVYNKTRLLISIQKGDSNMRKHLAAAAGLVLSLAFSMTVYAEGWDDNTYVSDVMNYQITVPENYSIIEDDMLDSVSDYGITVKQLSVGRDDGEERILGVYYPNYSTVTAKTMADSMLSMLTASGEHSLRERKQITSGGSVYEVIRLTYSDSLYQDMYIKKEGENLMLLQVVFSPDSEDEISDILSTLCDIR